LNVTPRVVFLDTSIVIALANKDDAYHERAKALDDELLREGAVLLFHWGILFEVADGFARIARRGAGFDCLPDSPARRDTRSHPSPRPCFRRLSTFTVPGTTRNGGSPIAPPSS
jgi:hypothetical protein